MITYGESAMPLHEQDNIFMAEALRMARLAVEHGEVPVGAVIVRDDQIIARGWNQPITASDPSAHAEIVALRHAAADLKNYRLTDTTLYVTLEPCIMCAGAIIHARIKRLVYGAQDPKTGAAGGVFDIFTSGKVNHVVAVEGGVMAEACGDLLRDFFRLRR